MRWDKTNTKDVIPPFTLVQNSAKFNTINENLFTLALILLNDNLKISKSVYLFILLRLKYKRKNLTTYAVTMN